MRISEFRIVSFHVFVVSCQVFFLASASEEVATAEKRLRTDFPSDGSREGNNLLPAGAITDIHGSQQTPAERRIGSSSREEQPNADIDIDVDLLVDGNNKTRTVRHISQDVLGKLNRKFVLKKKQVPGEVYLEDGYTYTGFGRDGEKEFQKTRLHRHRSRQRGGRKGKNKDGDEDDSDEHHERAAGKASRGAGGGRNRGQSQSRGRKRGRGGRRVRGRGGARRGQSRGQRQRGSSGEQDTFPTGENLTGRGGNSGEVGNTRGPTGQGSTGGGDLTAGGGGLTGTSAADTGRGANGGGDSPSTGTGGGQGGQEANLGFGTGGGGTGTGASRGGTGQGGTGTGAGRGGTGGGGTGTGAGRGGTGRGGPVNRGRGRGRDSSDERSNSNFGRGQRQRGRGSQGRDEDDDSEEDNINRSKSRSNRNKKPLNGRNNGGRFSDDDDSRESSRSRSRRPRPQASKNRATAPFQTARNNQAQFSGSSNIGSTGGGLSASGPTATGLGATGAAGGLDYDTANSGEQQRQRQRPRNQGRGNLRQPPARNQDSGESQRSRQLGGRNNNGRNRGNFNGHSRQQFSGAGGVSAGGTGQAVFGLGGRGSGSSGESQQSQFSDSPTRSLSNNGARTRLPTGGGPVNNRAVGRGTGANRGTGNSGETQSLSLSNFRRSRPRQQLSPSAGTQDGGALTGEGQTGSAVGGTAEEGRGNGLRTSRFRNRGVDQVVITGLGPGSSSAAGTAGGFNGESAGRLREPDVTGTGNGRAAATGFQTGGFRRPASKLHGLEPDRNHSDEQERLQQVPESNRHRLEDVPSRKCEDSESSEQLTIKAKSSGKYSNNVKKVTVSTGLEKDSSSSEAIKGRPAIVVIKSGKTKTTIRNKDTSGEISSSVSTPDPVGRPERPLAPGPFGSLEQPGQDSSSESGRPRSTGRNKYYRVEGEGDHEPVDEKSEKRARTSTVHDGSSFRDDSSTESKIVFSKRPKLIEISEESIESTRYYPKRKWSSREKSQRPATVVRISGRSGSHRSHLEVDRKLAVKGKRLTEDESDESNGDVPRSRGDSVHNLYSHPIPSRAVKYGPPTLSGLRRPSSDEEDEEAGNFRSRHGSPSDGVIQNRLKDGRKGSGRDVILEDSQERGGRSSSKKGRSAEQHAHHSGSSSYNSYLPPDTGGLRGSFSEEGAIERPAISYGPPKADRFSRSQLNTQQNSYSGKDQSSQETHGAEPAEPAGRQASNEGRGQNGHQRKRPSTYGGISLVTPTGVEKKYAAPERDEHSTASSTSTLDIPDTSPDTSPIPVQSETASPPPPTLPAQPIDTPTGTEPAGLLDGNEAAGAPHSVGLHLEAEDAAGFRLALIPPPVHVHLERSKKSIQKEEADKHALSEANKAALGPAASNSRVISYSFFAMGDDRLP